MANCEQPYGHDTNRCTTVGFYNEVQRVELDCPEDSLTLPAIGEVQYGTVFSAISLEDANEQALALAAQIAETVRSSRPCLYGNDETSFTATCPEPYEESSTVTIPENEYLSEISKAAANALALAAATERAQATLSCLFSNFEQEFTAECPDGQIGTPVTVVVEAGTYFSYSSQEDADAKALAAATSDATARVICLWENEEQTYEAVCPEGLVGEPVSATVLAGEYTSIASQEDANALALAAAKAEAESELECVWESVEVSFTAACPGSIGETSVTPPGAKVGESVTVTIPAGSYTSAVSQSDANAQALAAAQLEAEAALECEWVNDQQEFTAYCPEGREGDPVTAFVPVNTYSSDVSQADANAQALAQAEILAEEELVCLYWNTEQSAEYTAYCPEGGVGDPSIGYGVVLADTYSAPSQEAADALAYDAALAIATAEAEAGLVCCYQPLYTVTFNYDLAPVDPEDPENYLVITQSNMFYDCTLEEEVTIFDTPGYSSYGVGAVGFTVNPGGASGPFVGTGNWELFINGVSVQTGTLASPTGGELITSYSLA